MDGGEPAVRTKRLLLRPWQDADREPFAIINSDPRVMEHFVERYLRERSDSFLDRIRSRWGELGHALWATERLDTGAFIGYVGLWPAGFDAPFTPAVEVGWRLAAAQWGHGFATEGARAVLRYGFTTVGLADIVSFTSVTNRRSWRVMERLGMVRDAASDFDHPAVRRWGTRCGLTCCIACPPSASPTCTAPARSGEATKSTWGRGHRTRDSGHARHAWRAWELTGITGRPAEVAPAGRLPGSRDQR